MPFDIEDARARLAELEQSDPARLHAHISALARPRMAGSEGADAVEAELRRRFEGLGYRATELPFSFSSLPGRFGLAAAGGIMALAGLLVGILLPNGYPAAALIILILAMALALVPLLTLGTALERLPWGRVESRNLLFRTGEGRPTWILMAHRDSKSQLVPTLVRTAAVGVAALAWAALLVLSALWFGGEPTRFPGLAIAMAGLLFLAALALALSWAANESPGALDNATGLAALLEVAASSGATGDIAFLVTDGEELGLAGARAVAAHLPPVQGVINIDSLDDAGRFYVAEGYGWRRRGYAPQLAAGLLTAATVLGMQIERRTLPRSLLVDHLPIAEAGIPTLTLMRGDRRSLLRVHQAGDDADHIDGSGAARGVTLLLATMRLLREEEAAHLAGRRAAGA
jgi:hypothetical protein